MKRGWIAAILVAFGCGDTTAGRRCQPSDRDVCGPGFQCLTFCDAEGGPDSICTPSFGDEAGDTFDSFALIDGKIAFGELGNVRHFTGDLRIEIAGVAGVALPLVEDVAGDLTVVGTSVECLSMPRLVSVGGTFTIDANPSLVRSEVASLESAGGIVITENAALPSLDLSSLSTINGAFTVRDNAALKSISLDALTTVTGCVDVTTNECIEPTNLATASCCSNGTQLVSDDQCATCL